MHTQIYVWPSIIQALGWLIPLSSTLFIPALAVYQVWRHDTNGYPLGVAMFRPTRLWKPAQMSMSMTNLAEAEITSSAGSQRGSRTSFRKYLPPNAETLQ